MEVHASHSFALAAFAPRPMAPAPEGDGVARAGPPGGAPTHGPEAETSGSSDTAASSRDTKPSDRAFGADEPAAAREDEERKADEALIRELKARDREVRAHEQAHLAAAGGLARGGISYQTQRGPDGRQYAVGGEVSIDTSPVSGDPRATIAKAQQIRRAAMAPAQPSPQDRSVAAQATSMEMAARAELAAESADGTDGAPGQGSSGASESGAAPGPGERRAEDASGACPACGGHHGPEAHAAPSNPVEAAFRIGSAPAGLHVSVSA